MLSPGAEAPAAARLDSKEPGRDLGASPLQAIWCLRATPGLARLSPSGSSAVCASVIVVISPTSLSVPSSSEATEGSHRSPWLWLAGARTASLPASSGAPRLSSPSGFGSSPETEPASDLWPHLSLLPTSGPRHGGSEAGKAAAGDRGRGVTEEAATPATAGSPAEGRGAEAVVRSHPFQAPAPLLLPPQPSLLGKHLNCGQRFCRSRGSAKTWDV